jgi:DNA-binding IclR family transcriptional regulator
MTGSSDTSQTFSRGLDVLDLLAGSPTPLTSMQVAAALGLSRTIVYRLVGTLIERGLVRRDAHGKLTIGLAALRITERLMPTLRASVRPVLERLADDLAATSYLCVVDGTESLAVSVVEPAATTFHIAYREGSRHPLGVGAHGRALLAASQGRSETFASHGELIAGATGIAASLPGLPGLSAAVGIVTLTPLCTSDMGPRVRSSADELHHMLSTP